jgi:hypothetical protein
MFFQRNLYGDGEIHNRGGQHLPNPTTNLSRLQHMDSVRIKINNGICFYNFDQVMSEFENNLLTSNLNQVCVCMQTNILNAEFK